MSNSIPAEQYSVVYKRPTDLRAGKDVPICCNIVVCDMLDEGKFLTCKNKKLGMRHQPSMFMPWFEHGTCCV